MTTTQSAPAPTLDFTVTNGWPQVDLLPPEVRARRKLKKTKELLALMVVCVLLASVGGYGAAMFSASAAQTELDGVKKETSALMAKQVKFAEVPLVLGGITSIEQTRKLGMSTEILWKPYLDALRAVTPAGVSLDNVTVTAATPMQPAALAVDPLAPVSIGQVAFTAKSLALPDTSAWLVALASVPGFVHPLFSTQTLTQGDGVSYYQVTATVQVTDQAFANRFVPTKGN
jgi:hypothetical protein